MTLRRFMAGNASHFAKLLDKASLRRHVVMLADRGLASRASHFVTSNFGRLSIESDDTASTQDSHRTIPIC